MLCFGMSTSCMVYIKGALSLSLIKYLFKSTHLGFLMAGWSAIELIVNVFLVIAEFFLLSFDTTENTEREKIRKKKNTNLHKCLFLQT